MSGLFLAFSPDMNYPNITAVFETVDRRRAYRLARTFNAGTRVPFAEGATRVHVTRHRPDVTFPSVYYRVVFFAPCAPAFDSLGRCNRPTPATRLGAQANACEHCAWLLVDH